MFPPLKQHRQVVLPKTKIPCLEKVHVPQWELVALQAHLPAAKPTHRSGEDWQEEWKSNINNSEFRDTLLILSTSWGYEFSTLLLSHCAFFLKYAIITFCFSAVPSMSSHFISWASHWFPLHFFPSLMSFAFEHFSTLVRRDLTWRLLICTWDLGMGSWIGIMGLGSSCSLWDVDLGKNCCSAVWFPLWEESFSQSWDQNCSFFTWKPQLFLQQETGP